MKIFLFILFCFSQVCFATPEYDNARAAVFSQGQYCVDCHSEEGSQSRRNWMEEEVAVEFSDKIYDRVFVRKNMPRGNRPKIDDWPLEDKGALLEFLCSENVEAACSDLESL